MQGLHTTSSSSTPSILNIPSIRKHPPTHVPAPKHHSCSSSSSRLVQTCAAKKKGKGAQQQPKQQQGQQQQGTSFWEDPRLQWAKPEWIQQQSSKQVTQQQPQLQQQPSSSSGIAQVAAAARSNSLQRPAATPGSQNPLITEQERQRVLQKMTYGSLSSTDEDEPPSSSSSISSSTSSSSSSSSKPADVPQLFAAMGIDFGERRVGVAIRRPPYNIPLTVLWTESLQHQSDRSSTSSSSSLASNSSSTDTSSTTTSSSSSSSSSLGPANHPQPRRRINVHKLAQKLLQVALKEGCDGFVVGVPVFKPTTTPAIAVGRLETQTTPAERGTQRITENIRSFAHVLANAAAQYELPVLLVNEQQSSQQARAIRTGRAQYDVITLAELQQREQQQGSPGQRPRQQQQQGNQQQGIQKHEDTRQQQQDARQQQGQEQLQRPQQLPEPKQQQQQANEPSRKKREAEPGRDAYAAALILSRYCNGVVEPLEVVWASRQNQQQQQQRQQQ